MKSSIQLKVAFLQKLESLTKLSPSLTDYFVSGILRDLSKLIHDEEIENQLYQLGKEVAQKATPGLINGWEDGDPICPPYPPFPPFPHHYFDDIDYFKDFPASPLNIINAFSLKELASLVSTSEFKNAILTIGEKLLLMGQEKLLKEYKDAKRHIEFEIDKETSAFISTAHQHDVNLGKLLKNPVGVAKEMNISISENVAERIKNLNSVPKTNNYGIDDVVNKEIIEFYNKVVINGQYFKEWITNPEEVAEKLNIDVSQKAIERIKEIGIERFIDRRIVGSHGGEVMLPPVAVAVVVVIVIVLWDREIFDNERIIIDKSGIVKL